MLKANKIGSECFRLEGCDAQVGDDFHINPEEIEIILRSTYQDIQRS